MEDEDRRQNKRLDIAEENIRQMGALTTSVEKLATNMSSMVKEQEKQGEKLEKLESRDGEKWDKAVGYVIGGVIGAVIGLLF